MITTKYFKSLLLNLLCENIFYVKYAYLLLDTFFVVILITNRNDDDNDDTTMFIHVLIHIMQKHVLVNYKPDKHFTKIIV